MSRRLPLFPLDLVLFPGARIPLHIFEPRYQALLADVLAGDACFGLLAPSPDGEPPAKGTLGCVARIVSHQALPEGRANIIVEGESRFALRRILDESRDYLVGLVDEFGDEEGTSELPGDMVEQLRRLADRCRSALSVLTDEPKDGPWASDPETLTFQVAGALPWSSAQAHQLLTLRSAAQRADVLMRVLPRIVPDLESRAAVHRRASGNGHGHHAPDVPGER